MDTDTPYIERKDGFLFGTRYILRSPSGDELASFDDAAEAEDALVELIETRRKSKWPF